MDDKPMTKETFIAVLVEEGIDAEEAEAFWKCRPDAIPAVLSEETLRRRVQILKPLLLKMRGKERMQQRGHTPDRVVNWNSPDVPLPFLELVTFVRPYLANPDLWTSDMIDKILEQNVCFVVSRLYESAMELTDALPADNLIAAIGTAYVMGYYVGKHD